MTFLCPLTQESLQYFIASFARQILLMRFFLLLFLCIFSFQCFPNYPLFSVERVNANTYIHTYLSGYSLVPYRLFSYYYCISYPFSVMVFVHCVPITLYFYFMDYAPCSFSTTSWLSGNRSSVGGLLKYIVYFVFCLFWLLIVFYTLVKINFQENWKTETSVLAGLF